MGRRRILINALSLPRVGGGRSYLVNLLRELNRDSRGFRFTVLADPKALTATERGQIEVAGVRLPAGAGARSVLRLAYEEIALPLRARRFDLLYCLADLAPARARTPIVVALRNPHIYNRRFYDTIRLRVLGHLVRMGVRHAKRILFPTQAAADWISPTISIAPRRIAIVPHGVAPEAFQTDRAGPEPDGDHEPYLFLPAAIERHKRIEVLIRALQHVANPRLEAWIAGSDEADPAYGSELRVLAESLGLASRVRFLGPVPYPRVLHYYRGAVALAFPSLLETFGHPLLEAMLAGTPIIAADIPTLREVAGDVAVYFPPDDPLGLAHAIDELLRNPEAVKIRVGRGHARAAEFSWKRSVDRLCQVFDEVLAE